MAMMAGGVVNPKYNASPLQNPASRHVSVRDGVPVVSLGQVQVGWGWGHRLRGCQLFPWVKSQLFLAGQTQTVGGAAVVD